MRCPCSNCKYELCFKCNGHLSSKDSYEGRQICETCIANKLVELMVANSTYYDSKGNKVSFEEFSA